MTDETGKLRIDKWLWAARFFKTRSLAVAALENGRVLVNEARVKTAKTITPGDKLDIRIGKYQFLVEVLAISDKRGPASQAQKLYRETDESRERRATIAAQIRALPQPVFKGRPTKRDRREIEQFKHGK
jgi:ribosome-associated heat shock protein Hsp15